MTAEQQAAPDTGEEKTYENLQALAEDVEFKPQPETGNPSAPEPAALGGEEIAALLNLGFGIVAERRGDHWALSGDEARALGESADAVLQKYFPGLGMGVEATLIVTAAVVVLPRVMADLKTSRPPSAPVSETEQPLGEVPPGKPDEGAAHGG